MLERGLAKAYELGVYSPAVLEAQEHVNHYRPGRYERPREVSLDPGPEVPARPDDDDARGSELGGRGSRRAVEPAVDG